MTKLIISMLILIALIWGLQSSIIELQEVLSDSLFSFFILSILLIILILNYKYIVIILLLVSIIITYRMIFEFQDSTTLYLVKIIHPVPLEWKYMYFCEVFNEAYKLRSDTFSLRDILFRIEDPLSTIKDMNIYQIDDFVLDAINQIDTIERFLLLLVKVIVIAFFIRPIP